jgi:DNA polymerase-3 subunit alpha (Gram-positive type)
MSLNHLSKRIVWFDIETTGFNVFHNNIIEIAALDNYGNTFETLINPKCFIPKKITEITKIDNSMVNDKPCADEALIQFIDFINGTSLFNISRQNRRAKYCIGHNALAFDSPFINAQCKKYNIFIPEFKVIDTMRISQYILTNNYSHSLASLSEFFNIPNNNAHRAMSDVTTTKDIFILLISIFKSYNGSESITINDIDKVYELTTV